MRPPVPVATLGSLALLTVLASGAPQDPEERDAAPRGTERPAERPVRPVGAPMPPDVVFDTPSRDATGSMPLGNGDVAVNLWVEEDGDLGFTVSKADAWSGNMRLLKLGRVRVALDPSPFVAGAPFEQRLRTRAAEVVVDAGPPGARTRIRAWVDAEHPTVELAIASERPVRVRATLELWRTEPRELEGAERHSAYGLHDGPDPIVVEPDVLLPAGTIDGHLVWAHRNERSIWKANLELQGLGERAERGRDPLLHRVFGGALGGEGLEPVDATTLASTAPGTDFALRLTALTRWPASLDAWLRDLRHEVRWVGRFDLADRRIDHLDRWRAFWERSWIVVRGDADAEAVTRGYALQRYVQACAGRGAYPIKFNGSLFTVDSAEPGPYDADYRRWGGPYWWQNTRLPYWSMLAAGDFELMGPLFGLYLDALPLARERTRRWYGHGGAFFPETMTLWGTYVDANYGRDREGKPDGLTDNRYIRYEWQGGLELVMLVLDAWQHAGDLAFLADTVLPLATEVLAFYDEHYPRDADGRLRIEPGQALETWWDVANPAPELAGLRAALDRLLGLPAKRLDPELRVRWTRLRAELPELPTREVDGARVLAPAAAPLGEHRNSEAPELYAVFPYRLYGVGKPDLELARRTYRARSPQGTGGWRQDAIFAAGLGLADEAAAYVAQSFAASDPRQRFSAFWGPNFDWTPDQCHGAVAMIALQRMLLAADGTELRLLPAWPTRWEADFRLHAPFRTVVEGRVRDGQLEGLEVRPVARRAHVVVGDAE